MVLRVDVPVQELVLVHVSVHKVLPCVHDEHGDQELDELDEDGRLCFGSPQVCLGCNQKKQLSDCGLKKLLQKNPFDNARQGNEIFLSFFLARVQSKSVQWR